MRATNLMRGAAAFALVAMFSIGTAQAATISGFLNFGGQAVATGGSGLGDATGLSFPSGLIATNSTGDLSSISIGANGSINAFTFSPSSAVNPLLSIGGFSYALSSVSVQSQSNNFLALTGMGTLSGNGFDATAYNFSMSVDTAGGGVAFSGTLAPVPVPGALLLMMSGLAALGFRKRS